MERCYVCEQDISRGSLAKLLRTDGHLLEAANRIRCDFCWLSVKRKRYENELLNDSDFRNRIKGFKKYGSKLVTKIYLKSILKLT